MHKKEGIRISRPVDQASQEAINTLVKELMPATPDAEFEPRELETLGQTLIEWGECRLGPRWLGKSNSKKAYSQLYYQVLEKSIPPTAFGTLTLPVVGVEYLSRNQLQDTSVALMLAESNVIARERQMYAALIDKIVGKSLPWKDMTPHVSIGRVKPEHATNDLIERARDHAQSIGTITLSAIHTSEGPLIRPYRTTLVHSSTPSLEDISVRRIDQNTQPNPDALQALRTMGTHALNG